MDFEKGVATQVHDDPNGNVWAPLETNTTLYNHFWFWAPEKEEKRKGSQAKFHDVLYPDLLADPMGTIAKLYRAFGLELSTETAHRMKRYLKENPQHKHGKHHYSLEEFGLDEQKIKEQYGPYCKRFGLW